MKPILTKTQFLNSYKLKKFALKSMEKYKINFPIYGNEDLVKIISFLTFNGHLYLSEKAFLFTSSLLSELKEIERLVKKEFNLIGKYRKIKSNFGTCYEYRIISAPISRILKLLDTPTGSKVKQTFLVPTWIKNNLEFARLYLKIAFDCEGSIWKEPNRMKIRFKLHKIEEKLENGKLFMKDMKDMLKRFNIETTKTWIINGNLRKDGYKTKGLVFDIKTKSLESYKEQIGFNNINKRNKLIKWGR
ncbi:MAG: LAGLIDADG family homing endonuclease [Candidatus Aenigmatarchaeota archaeon]